MRRRAIRRDERPDPFRSLVGSTHVDGHLAHEDYRARDVAREAGAMSSRDEHIRGPIADSYGTLISRKVEYPRPHASEIIVDPSRNALRHRLTDRDPHPLLHDLLREHRTIRFA